MTLLTFDCARALDDACITSEQLQCVFARLEELRDQTASTEELLAYSLLSGYDKQREASELGRVFQVANRLHDQVDAVVVLASAADQLAARALMTACCHPLHNEMCRGDRGSKPRMYFDGDSIDNDSTQALLERLSQTPEVNDCPISEWAAIVIGANGPATSTGMVLPHYLRSLSGALGSAEGRSPGEFVFPIAEHGQAMHADLTRLNCSESFALSGNVAERSVFSVAGVLPAAVLGLDCIQLLDGALSLHRHFKIAPPSENVVLQYVAINYILSAPSGTDARLTGIWNKALEGVGAWYNQLLCGVLRQRDASTIPGAVFSTRDWHGGQIETCIGRAPRVVNNVVVNSCRADHLSANLNEHETYVRGKSLLDVSFTRHGDANAALQEIGCVTTDILLPEISTHTLGQLFQMLMLATELERALLVESATS